MNEQGRFNKASLFFLFRKERIGKVHALKKKKTLFYLTNFYFYATVCI